MSTHSQVEEFLDKLDELRAVFVLGRRSFPFLKELICFVQDVTVLLEELDATIQDSTGHMPRATSQLKSVSEATELATSEILDLIDEALGELSDLEEQMMDSADRLDALADADERLVERLDDALGEAHAALKDDLAAWADEKRALRREARRQMQGAREALQPIRAVMNRITMSLQVQDITAQQIAGVNHLIESVRDRMNELLTRLGSGEAGASETERRGAPRTRTFDSNARYDRSPDRQRMADDVMANLDPEASDASGPVGGDGETAGTSDDASPAPPETASQSDIDAMFGAESSSESSAHAGNDASEGDGGEVTSQEDIDELFQQGL
jgi:chemotaxis regulatin CheY-phosphate phosphatase CheZ